MMNVIFAVLVLGVIAVVFGLVLSVAAKAFEGRGAAQRAE